MNQITLTRADVSALPEAPLSRGAGFVASTLVIARRTVLKFLRTPQLVVVGTIQGAMFLLIFRYVFGGAIDVGGMSYVDFLVPGFIVTSVLFAGAGAAAGVAEDIDEGVFDRLRSLPSPKAAAMAGRSVADTLVAAWSLAITILLGFAVGFRIHGGVGSALVAYGLCVLFAFAFAWVFIVIGLVAGNAQAAQGMSLLVFPLTFVSSAYVPVATMPSWLRPFAEHQPLTLMTNAVRSLTQGAPMEQVLGHPASYYISRSLLWVVGILVVFVPLTVWRYARR